MQFAESARMARRFSFAFGPAAAVTLLLRAATGCNTANNPAGPRDAGEDATTNDAVANSDAGDGGVAPNGCNAGCLCFGVDACPVGCYPSVTEAPDGSGSAPFCSNGIVQCVAGGFSWSLGVPANNCPGGPSTYLDSGPAPDGSFCCHYHQDAVPDASAADAGDANVAESGAGRLPINYRPSDAPCSTSAPPGDCYAPYPDAGCASDNDCAEAGTNGRCINPGGGPAAPCFCTFDECLVDADCPSDQTCACHGAPYTDGHGNMCVTGNCRVDADCGPADAGFCSPSSTTGTCGDSLAGYYCHTAADLCVNDSDCPTSSTVVGTPGCLYSTTDSRWECAVVPYCD